MDISKRMINLFRYAVDCSFGSIWQIKENFWRKNFRNYKSNRSWHPGFSILRQSADDASCVSVPFLFGTSKKYAKAFCVKGLRAECRDDKCTWFGTIEKPIPHACLGDFAGKKPLIERNMHKPWANDAELKKAEQFLKDLCRRKRGRR